MSLQIPNAGSSVSVASSPIGLEKQRFVDQCRLGGYAVSDGEVVMFDTFLEWSAALAFLLALCTPVLIALYGTRGAKWSMIAIAALCAASFWFNWTTDFHDEVLTGNSNAAGILMSIAAFVFASVVVAVSLTVRHLFGTRKPMTGEPQG